MESFLFVNPDGEVYKEEFDGNLKRHGHIARVYMEQNNLTPIDVEIDTENGFYWGKEVAKNHSIFAIQDSRTSAGIYIPSILTKSQILWIENYLNIEIEKYDGKLLVCNFIEDRMDAYHSLQDNALLELKKCLKEKGVNISIYKGDDVNEFGNKRRNI